VLAAAIASIVGCGSPGDEASTVAQPVAPPDLPSAGVPRSHAVEPRAGDGGQSGADGSAQSVRDPAEGRTSDARAEILSAADRASFERLAASLGGQHGLAVSSLGMGQRVERVGSLRSAVAWSTGKVPVAMAVIAAGGAQAERQDLTRAITASDNAAATRLWSELGHGATAAGAATEQLRQAGDQRTQLEYRTLRAGYTPFGQTRWALADQARFRRASPA
jgi:beta-lactamase class A